MSTRAHIRAATRTPWPTNLGAYTKVITGAVPLVGVGASLLADTSPEMLAAAALAGVRDLTVLRVGPPWLKIAASWVGTWLAALVLVAGSYEGEAGLTWSGIGQWDTSDLATIVLLSMGSLIHTLIPNAPAQVPTAAVPGDVLAVADAPAWPTASTAGEAVPFASDTAVLRAVTVEPAAPAAPSGRRAAAVPVPAAPPAVEDDAVDLDVVLARRAVTL